MLLKKRHPSAFPLDNIVLVGVCFTRRMVQTKVTDPSVCHSVFVKGILFEGGPKIGVLQVQQSLR